MFAFTGEDNNKVVIDLTVSDINTTDFNSDTSLDTILEKAKNYDPHTSLDGYDLGDLKLD